MDSFCGTSRVHFVGEIFLRILNIYLKNLLTLEKILINTFFISFAEVMQSKACQYCCGNTLKLEVNFLFQNTPSRFQTSIGTFNRVSCFPHTIKNCLCIRFTRFVFFHTKLSQRVGWVANKIVSYFCFTWNYLFVNNGDLFMLHLSVYTWIHIDFGIMTATRLSTVNVHKVAFSVANLLNIQRIELFVVIIILSVTVGAFKGIWVPSIHSNACVIPNFASTLTY